jgi:hypothetical protein
MTFPRPLLDMRFTITTNPLSLKLGMIMRIVNGEQTVKGEQTLNGVLFVNDERTVNERYMSAL